MKTPIDMFPGSKHETSNSGQVVIIKYNRSNNVEVEFISTGSRKIVQAGDIRIGRIKDLMCRSVYNVGFIGCGNHKAYKKGCLTKAYLCWGAMMSRCYSEVTQKRSPAYIGCAVCIEWHNFQIFACWFDKNHIEGFDLDKDIKIKGSRIYSPETCLFVSRHKNIIAAHAKSYELLSPEGENIIIYNMAEFCRHNNLCKQGMSAVCTGRVNKYKGWTKSNRGGEK